MVNERICEIILEGKNIGYLIGKKGNTGSLLIFWQSYSKACREMICIETHFSLNRTLLIAMGLWPYKRTKLVRLQSIVFLSIMTSAILFQFTALLTVEHISDILIKVLSISFLFIGFVIKYIFFPVNIENVKYLLMQLQYIYNDLKDEYENVIVEKYSCYAKWYTASLTIFAACSIFTFIVAQFGSNIIDVVLSRNTSRSHHLIVTTEYFINQEKHFYLILLHIYATVCLGFLTIIAIGTLLIAYLQHICGMLSISSYRIESAMKINMLQNIKNDNLILEGIIRAADIHRQAMRLSELLISKFEIMLFSLIIIGVLFLSFNLFRVRSSDNNITELLFPVVFITISILYMFIANYIGQDVMDHTNHIFVTVYNVQWYEAPLHIQRIILFLLQRGAKNFTLSVGGLFTGSLECFATLLKASVSYFTVMYSI